MKHLSLVWWQKKYLQMEGVEIKGELAGRKKDGY